MPSAAPEFHLIVDHALLGDPTGTTTPPLAPATVERPATLETVRVPGFSYLRTDAPTDKLVGDTPTEDSFAIEPVADGPRSRLLLVAPRNAPAPRVNGRRAPRICLLRTGDQLLLADGRLLHLTAFHNPPIDAATEQQAGIRCLICRTPVKAGSRVFCCPSCDSLMHCDDPAEAGDGDRLECAKLPSSCPGCRHPMKLDGGFDYVPDL